MARAEKTMSKPIEIDTWWYLKHLCNHMYLVRQGCPSEKKVHIASRTEEAGKVMAEIEVKLASLEVGFEPTCNVPLSDVEHVSASRVLEVEERVDRLLEAVVVKGAVVKSGKWSLATWRLRFRRPEGKEYSSQGARLACLKRRLVRLEKICEELRTEKWSLNIDKDMH